jgi:hypothetical protein
VSNTRLDYENMCFRGPWRMEGRTAGLWLAAGRGAGADADAAL